MRILCCHPGADWATADVYNGLVAALQALGVECVPFSLNTRIDRAASWLHFLWDAEGRPDPKPNDADISYQASIGVLERALRLRADWVLIFSAMFLHPDAVILLRRAGVRTALVLTESPYQEQAEKRLLRWVELGWTNERTCLESYREANPDVFYLPHAYDPEKHQPLAEGGDPHTAVLVTTKRSSSSSGPDMTDGVPAHDVVFVGTPFPERVELLEAVDWSGIDLGLYGFWDEALTESSPLRPHIRGGVVTNDVAVALYRRAKIGLNLFRTSRGFEDGSPRVEGAESLNPRALELAACGVFQISEWRAEVEEAFGSSVPTFRNAEELEFFVRVFLDQRNGPTLRAAHAANARRRIQGRTFDVRARQVLDDLTRVSGLTRSA